MANEAATAKVLADKLREVLAGHDGTWAAHPGLVPLVNQVFNAHMKRPNQLDVMREDVKTSEEDLLQMPKGTKSLEGLRLNTRVGVQVGGPGGGVEGWGGGGVGRWGPGKGFVLYMIFFSLNVVHKKGCGGF